MRTRLLPALMLAAVTLGAQSAPGPNTVDLGALTFRFIGPPGNRVDAVVGVPGNSAVYYAGAASGGIFKTTDGGVHWSPVSDALPVASIGALAVTPSAPNVVWAGTGEAFLRSGISIGAGVYKSEDSGATWRLMGLENTGRIARIVVDPRHPDTIYVCALGSAYQPQPERGVFRTIDGGRNWRRVLFVDANTGCSDLALDPSHPNTLFAGAWQVQLRPWARLSGGPGSGLYRSRDGGTSWQRLAAPALPHPPLGKVAVALAPGDGRRVYALIETGDGEASANGGETGALWSSRDGGDSWQRISSDRDLRGRPAYFTRAVVSPKNPDELYFLGTRLLHSLDGGGSTSPTAADPGSDNHDLWIDPNAPQRLIVANDGGVAISLDAGQTWNRVQLPIAQIYHVTTDDQIPYRVYGNVQDGASVSGPSQTGGASNSPIPRGLWQAVGGGESGFATPDPHNPDLVWSSGTGSGSAGGVVTRFNRRTGETRAVEVWPVLTTGAAPARLRYRFNWAFPLAISPFDSNRVYVGSQFVHLTTDGGDHWRTISPDLTLNRPDRQGNSGGLTVDNSGAEYAASLSALAESPRRQGLIWAGTYDGQLQRTRDGGASWSNLTARLPGLPADGFVSALVPSPLDPAVAYVAVDRHQLGDSRSYLFKTGDYGATWTAIVQGIPPSAFSNVRALAADPVRRGLLFAGTENGLYVSFNDGARWQPLQNNLPHVPIAGLTVQPRFHDLVVATYGRGLWILDDIAALEQWPGASPAAELFPPRTVWRLHAPLPAPGAGYDVAAGRNPPAGAAIDYYLAAPAPAGATVEIDDAAGHPLRRLRGPSNPGLNRVWWDLRGEPNTWPGVADVPPIALLAPPATYTALLQLPGRPPLRTSLSVLADPRSTAGADGIAAQTRLAAAIVADMIQAARLAAQLESRRQPAAQPLLAQLFRTAATGHGQDDLRSPPGLMEQYAHLYDMVANWSFDYAPTAEDQAAFEELHRRLLAIEAAIQRQP